MGASNRQPLLVPASVRLVPAPDPGRSACAQAGWRGCWEAAGLGETVKAARAPGRPVGRSAGPSAGFGAREQLEAGVAGPVRPEREAPWGAGRPAAAGGQHPRAGRPEGSPAVSQAPPPAATSPHAAPSGDGADGAGVLALQRLLSLGLLGNPPLDPQQVELPVELAGGQRDVVSARPHFHPEQAVHGAVV